MRRLLYTLVLFALIPVAWFHLLWRARRQPEYLQHVGERFGRYSARPSAPVIWIHAVSVGETRAAEPLLKALKQRYTDHAIVMTHTTPTGRAAGEQLYGDRVSRCYLPYDLPFAVERFLNHFDPKVGVLMETELWPNLIQHCEQRHIPLFLVNARLSEKSARGYSKIATLIRESLQSLSGIAAQTDSDAKRLSSLGAPAPLVTGSMKFDIAVPNEMLTRGEALRELIGRARPVFLAASTREGEEPIVLDAFSQLNVPNALLLLVPRHPQRFDEVAKLLQERGLRFARKSRGDVVSASTQILLGDSMGEMFAYYAACDIAFIGGSLVPLGGQNLIEACAVGKPVLIGPHTFNFAEASDLATEIGAAVRVNDAKSLAAAAEHWLKDPNGRERASASALEFANEHRGATARVMRMIESKWSPSS